MSELFRDISSIVGLIGGCIGVMAGWYTFKKLRLEAADRKKADIRIKIEDEPSFSNVSIQNDGNSIAKNVEVKVFNKYTQQVLADHFETPFPSTLNVGQESTRTWDSKFKLSRHSEHTVIIVSWDDDFGNNRMLEQTVRY